MARVNHHSGRVPPGTSVPLQANYGIYRTTTTRGGQPFYSPLAILTALTLRAVFRLAYRQAEGLIGSIVSLLGLTLRVPEHTTLSRRSETLSVPQPQPDNTDVGNAENLFLHLRWPQTDSKPVCPHCGWRSPELSSLTRLPRRLSPAIVESLLRRVRTIRHPGCAAKGGKPEEATTAAPSRRLRRESMCHGQ